MIFYLYIIYIYIYGWWLTYPSDNMKVSWGYDSQLNGKKVPNHQPDIYIYKHHVSHENDRICVQTGNIFTMNKTL